jgi:hypothetical protein
VDTVNLQESLSRVDHPLVPAKRSERGVDIEARLVNFVGHPKGQTARFECITAGSISHHGESLRILDEGNID